MDRDMTPEPALPFDEESLFARDINGQLVRMDRVTARDFDEPISIHIDGRPITVPKAVPRTDALGIILRDADGRPRPRATTIYDAASRLFATADSPNPIPTLCHQEHLEPVGVCRLCVVEIRKVKDGKPRIERKLLPACQHRVEQTMEVHTMASPDEKAARRVRSAVAMLTELLAADHLRDDDPKSHARYNELARLADRFQVSKPRFESRSVRRGHDDSSMVIAVDHEACILCDRCARGCDDVVKNHIIGRTGKGYTTRIGFDLDDPMGKSGCVSCGECMISCPTGALTFRRPVPAAIGMELAGEIVPAEELREHHEIFAGVPYKFLQWNASSVRRRRLRTGDLLCREGDQGSTAFLLINGSFEVSIKAALKQLHKEKATGWRAFVGRVRTRLTASKPSDSGATIGPIRSDAGAPLPFEKPIAIRTPADIIMGEMTCMSHYPRSATVRALEECEVLEINRNVLHMLRRSQASREILNRVYRERALRSHLQNSPLLASLDEPQRERCADYLRDKVDLVRVDPGQTIFRQGEPGDHMYVVHLGFVKVTQSTFGQERVLNYLGPGATFGEIALLTGMPELAEHFPEDALGGLRTSTCAALDDVELVCIRGEHFRELIADSNDLRDRLIERAKKLLASDAAARRWLDKPLGEFLEQGLFDAQKLLVLDLESCTRCDECTKACADTHDGVTRLIREGLRFDKFLVASSCRSCLDPYCLVGCPVDAIHRQQRDDLQASLEIVIDDRCIGCGLCERNCPYGNISLHKTPEQREDPNQPGRSIAVQQTKAVTCDLCRDVVDADQDPSCVYACPHKAAFRMSGRELLKLVSRDARASGLPSASGQIDSTASL